MSAAEAGDQKSLMDDVYALHRHFYDFTRKFYLFGRDRLIRDLAPPPGGTVYPRTLLTGPERRYS